MSRVTFVAYCERRAKLNQVWQNSRGDLSDLSPDEQWVLHEYYRFAESLTNDQLHQHWSNKRDGGSSLPQRAGRAYAAFELVLANKPALVNKASQPVAQKRKRNATYKVRSLVHPQPDMRKLARVLFNIARRNERS